MSSPGCARFAAASGFCRQHSEPAHVDRPAADRAQRRAIFEQRLAGGDYRELFGPELNKIMRQAAAEASVDDEIGALRYAMARVLAEEDDPLRLSQAVAKLGAATVAAIRARRLLAGETADALTNAVTSILLELEP